MFEIKDGHIYITRGDIATITITAKSDMNRRHVFEVGDVIRFKVTDKSDCGCVKLTKDVEVTEATPEVEIYLSHEDTKLDEVISKIKEYWYEVELNPDTAPQTIIGYDSKGAKKFILYPEGSDVNE